MERKKRKSSIIIEVAVYFLVGIIMTGILTYITETRLYDKNVKKQTEFHAEEIAEEVKAVVREYPAYKWLVSYWYYNSDRMDIEYDAATDGNTLTAEKCRIFEEKYPQLQLRYLEEEQIGTLPEEDKKLYAEIAYSWLITRVNQIKRAYRVDYLFCVISKEPFDKQFFLFSGAEDGVVRGTSYEQVYPIGHVVT
ncbi:MAG: hypothetical protein J6Y89_07440, partial [Lachnospiraceae bacterium]|nr:hypothetical protein [Lachnospiraceae bacterium]